MPTLGDVRGKIVFFSRSEFFYDNIYEYQSILKKIKKKQLLMFQ